LPLLYGIVVLVGVAWAFDSPSRAALLPTLVPRDAFPRAVTIASTNQALAFTTGPVACGWTIAAAGIGSVYALDALLVPTSLVAASPAGLLVLRAPTRDGGGPALTLRAIREALAFVRRHQVMLGCMLLDMLAVVFGGAAALLPVYATDILRVGARGYGVLAAS